jgi:hypothetical protein
MLKELLEPDLRKIALSLVLCLIFVILFFRTWSERKFLGYGDGACGRVDVYGDVYYDYYFPFYVYKYFNIREPSTLLIIANFIAGVIISYFPSSFIVWASSKRFVKRKKKKR